MVMQSTEHPSLNDQAAPLTPAQIDRLHIAIRSLGRACKAVSLYPTGNPMLTAAIAKCHKDFFAALADVGQVTLVVEAERLTCDGHSVCGDKGDESALTRALFEGGVASMCFTPGFSAPDLDSLFGVLRQLTAKKDGERDAEKIFWEAGIAGLALTYVNDQDLLDYDSELRAITGADRSEESDPTIDSASLYAQIFSGDKGEDPLASPTQTSEPVEHLVATLADESDQTSGPNPSAPTPRVMLGRAYSLEERERSDITAIVCADGSFDPDQGLADIVVELLCSEGQLADFADCCAVAERTQADALRRGKFHIARQIVRALMDRKQELGKSRPMWAQKATESLTGVTSKERLRSITEPLNADPALSPDDALAYLSVFDWSAYAAIADLLGDLSHREHRMALCDFLANFAKDQPDLIANGVYDKRWFVARNSVMILGRIGGARIGKHLEKALGNSDPRVRAEVIYAARTLTGEAQARVLIRGLMDSDLAIQKNALDVVQNLDSQSSAKIYSATIERPEFAKLANDTQEMIFSSYANTGGAKGMATLADMAGTGPWFRATLTPSQKLALTVLEQCAPVEATEVLKRLSRNFRLAVRNRAKQALESRQARRR